MVISLGVLVVLSGNGRAAAAAAELKIADLDCGGSPEVVEIENEGPDSQDLAGWKLVSEPTATEEFDLSPIGTLPAGGSVFIESGPSSQATFQWSSSQIFRDNDSGDFVRLIDETGQTRDEAACSAQVTASASPTPSSTPAPTATPTTAPAVDVPNGGGPPSEVTGLASRPLTVIFAGGALLAVGLALSVASLGGIARSRKRQEAVRGGGRQPALPTINAPLKRAPRAPENGARHVLLMLVLTIAAAIVVAMFSQGPGARQRD
jgi:hypothetical protein